MRLREIFGTPESLLKIAALTLIYAGALILINVSVIEWGIAGAQAINFEYKVF